MCDKCTEPVHVFPGPFTDLSAQAKVRPFGANDKYPNIGFAGFANGFLEALGETRVQTVVGRIRQYDIPNVSVAFKSDAFHDLSFGIAYSNTIHFCANRFDERNGAQESCLASGINGKSKWDG